MLSTLFATLAFLACAVDATDMPKRLVRRTSAGAPNALASEIGKVKQHIPKVTQAYARSEKQHGTERKRWHETVLADIENMVRAGTSPEPAKIKTIKDIVNDELLPDLTATHASAVSDVASHKQEIEDCNSRALAELQSIHTTTE